MIVVFTLGEADTICRLRGCDNDFLHAQLAGCFDDVVSAHDIHTEAFVVGYEHVTCICRKVDDSVRGPRVLGKAYSPMSKSEVSAFMACPLSERSVFSVYIDPPVGRLALGKSMRSMLSTLWPFDNRYGRTCRPALPEPPVKAMRLPESDAILTSLCICYAKDGLRETFRTIRSSCPTWGNALRMQLVVMTSIDLRPCRNSRAHTT